MKAIILAAGRGSRMKHLTDERPKCLVYLRGKPLIEWQLEAIRTAGITEIAIVTGYRNELLSSYNLVEFHNSHWSKTNMVSSLECAEKWLQAEPCVISYSDIFYESSAVSSLMNCPASLAVTYDPNWLNLWKKRFADPLLDAETFLINSANEVLEIGKKPRTVEEVQGQYVGLLRMTPESWKHIASIHARLPKHIRDKMHMTGTLQKVIEHARFPVLGVPYQSEWGEFDTESDLKTFDTN